MPDGKDWKNDWFPRMTEYGFGEEDYREVIVKNVENPKLGGRPATDVDETDGESHS